VKKFLSAVIMSLALLCGFAAGQDRPLGNWVVDNAKILQPDQLSSVQSYSQTMERETGIRLGLVTFASTSADPKQLAVDTINGWQMGPKSVLVLISLNPRKVYIQPGNALVNSLNTDVCTGICKNTMVPYLKNGDWYNGILAGFRDIRSKAQVQAVGPPAPAQPQQRTVTKTTTTQTNTQSSSGSSGPSAASVLTVFGVIIGGIFALFLFIAFLSWLFEPREKVVYTSGGGYSGGSYNPTPVGTPPPAPAPVSYRPTYSSGPSYAYSPPPVSYSPPPVVVSPPVVYGGSNNGLVEGMILGEMMSENRHHHHDSGGYRSDDSYRNNSSTTTTVTETISYSDPSPPSSSSWDSSSSSSSSSYDSGSFGGGSFDCGGGGGGGSDF